MYLWYKRSHVCFEYLNDVRCREEETEIFTRLSWTGFADFRPMPPNKSLSEDTSNALQASGWFTRAWTLQELIAPRHVTFVDDSWRCFGSRDTLNKLVSSITGIANVACVYLWQQSVARKMSWASRRKSTRSEDLSYSLMGLFDVNMPLLYGEGGEKAFQRLQLEIIKTSTDESLFAWQPGIHSGNILAPLPSYFLHAANICPFPPKIPRAPYAMTNHGLEINTVLLKGKKRQYGGGHWRYFLPLNCWRKGELSPLVVPLLQTGTKTYVRAGTLAEHESSKELEWPVGIASKVEGHCDSDTIYITDFASSFRNPDESKFGALHDQESLHPLQNALSTFPTIRWQPW